MTTKLDPLYPSATGDTLVPETKDVLVMVRGGNKSAGALVQIDLYASDADTATAGASTPSAIFGTAIAPTAGGCAGTDAAYFGVMLADTTDDTVGVCRVRGSVSALVLRASGNIVLGTELAANTNGYLKAASADGNRILAFGSATVTAPTSATLADVYFDGIRGFGAEGSSGFATAASVDAAITAQKKVITWSQGSPTASENRTLQRFARAATLTGAVGTLVGSTSLTVVLKHGQDRSAAGTTIETKAITSTTSGDVFSLVSVAIAAGDYLWLTTTAMTGTPDEASVTIEYTGG